MSQPLDPREREHLLEDLASVDEEVRRLGVERLVALPFAESLSLLAERLGDASWRVRKAAVETIASLPDDAPVAPCLVAALADGEDPGRRNAAVEALVRIGRRMVEPLLAASVSDDVDVRKLVVDALAGIGSARAVPRLIEMLEDPDANVRGATADALAAIGGEVALTALRGAALREGEEALVRFAALRGLARVGAPLRAADLAALLDDSLLRPAVFGVLGRTLDPEAEALLLKGLEASSRATREAAIEALVRIVGTHDAAGADALVARIRSAVAAAPAVVDDATLRLGEADLATQLLLVQFLGLLGTPAVAAPLLRAAHGDEALREVALGALAGMGDAAETAVEAAWSALDGDLRVLACEALARTDGAAGAARLLTSLEGSDPSLRAAAARSLARRGDPRAVGPLLRRLQRAPDDADFESEEERGALIDALVAIASAAGRGALSSEVAHALADAFEGAAEPVRVAIARVLGSVGAAEHASLLALLVQDPSPAVRRAGVSAFARVRGETGREALRLALADEAASVRSAAATALGDAADPAALIDLERLLCDEDADVRAATVRAVAELSLATACDLDDVAGRLEAALSDTAPVALAAVEAYERLAPALSLEPVQRVLAHADPEVVQGAVSCLRRHGRDEDLAALVPVLGHAHWAVRAGVIEAIAERKLRGALPALMRHLDGEDDAFVRAALLGALERLEEA